MCPLQTELGCLVGSNAYLTPAGKVWGQPESHSKCVAHLQVDLQLFDILVVKWYKKGLFSRSQCCSCKQICITRCKQRVGGRVQAGLAPHHDDVELFVCHTEGRKRWRVYAPTAGFALPTRSSGDLPAAGLGVPLLEAVLEPGDVLYLPRGTVHAAEAEGGAGACHVTVSMYQRWTIATALQVPCWPMSSGQAAGGARLHAVNGIQQHTSTDSLLRDWRCGAQHLLAGAEAAQAEPACLPLQLRRGLPPGFLYEHGLQVDAAGPQGGAGAPAGTPSLSGCCPHTPAPQPFQPLEQRRGLSLGILCGHGPLHVDAARNSLRPFTAVEASGTGALSSSVPYKFSWHALRRGYMQPVASQPR